MTFAGESSSSLGSTNGSPTQEDDGDHSMGTMDGTEGSSKEMEEGEMEGVEEEEATVGAFYEDNGDNGKDDEDDDQDEASREASMDEKVAHVDDGDDDGVSDEDVEASGEVSNERSVADGDDDGAKNPAKVSTEAASPTPSSTKDGLAGGVTLAKDAAHGASAQGSLIQKVGTAPQSPPTAVPEPGIPPQWCCLLRHKGALIGGVEIRHDYIQLVLRNAQKGRTPHRSRL